MSLGFGSDSGIYRCMVPLRHVAYVIVQPCIDVKDASCVEVCPVDCIPVNPDRVETRGQLLLKYESLMAEKAAETNPESR